ncbi:helix-turn-helix transcriptional regulator [Cryobacterium fucosi]|uniref:helix-turn-helix transcriptional regulator n=1 Tax=Cryobacterium fucosi TaxID=1259157 RepID=UPI00141BDFEE|nr:helix-turn-helix transcriptional regulator [Cryobacterium fucosi]
MEAIRVLGRQITAGRRMLNWTQSDLAERAGVSVSTLLAIEKGSTGAAIGTVFEIAALVGIPLVGAMDPVGREIIENRLALLPTRVGNSREDDDDGNF